MAATKGNASSTLVEAQDIVGGQRNQGLDDQCLAGIEQSSVAQTTDGKTHVSEADDLVERLTQEVLQLANIVGEAVEFKGKTPLTGLVLKFDEILIPLGNELAVLQKLCDEVTAKAQATERQLEAMGEKYAQAAKEYSDCAKAKALLESKEDELALAKKDFHALLSSQTDPFGEDTPQYVAELKAAKEKGAQLQKQVEDLTAAEKAVKRASGTNVPAEMSSLMDQLSGFQMKQAAHNESIKKLLHVIASFQTIEFDCKGLLLATPLLTTEKVASLVATCTSMILYESQIRELQTRVISTLANTVTLYSKLTRQGNEQRAVSTFINNLGGRPQPKGDKSGNKTFSKDTLTLASDLSSMIFRDSFDFAPKHGAFNLNNGELGNAPAKAKSLLLAIHQFIKAYRSTFEKACAGGVAFEFK